jgi:hypothetical protein
LLLSTRYSCVLTILPNEFAKLIHNN